MDDSRPAAWPGTIVRPVSGERFALRTIEETDSERQRDNPVDVVEIVAESREWAFERAGEDELALSVAGRWTQYSVSFAWIETCEALHLGCAFDLAVPEERETEVLRLVSRINGQLIFGHFDLCAKEGAIMFRHALLLSGGADPTLQQAERLLASAVENCERFLPAFQFVAWNGKSASEALACSLFETVGNA